MIAIDAGNTKIACAYFRGDRLVRQWQMNTTPLRKTDEYRQIFNEWLGDVDLSLTKVEQMTVASVVPAVTEELKPLSGELSTHFVDWKSPISYHIAIPNPECLGADRIANLEGAVRKYGTPVIVVDVGTAITVNVVNRAGDFLGGAIAPGVGISLDALFSSAALLHREPLNRPAKAIGSDTMSAIESGIHYGFAALVDGLVKKAEEELGEPDVKIVGKGGVIDMLSPFIDPQMQLYPTLTLEGLRFIYENLGREIRIA